MRQTLIAALLLATTSIAVVAQSLHPRLIEAGATSELPQVVPNDNRMPAGTQTADLVDVDLEVIWADWRVETPDGPGLRVEAIAEVGKAPTIPGPLIRAETGMTIRVSVRNTLTDSSLVVFGLQTRPARIRDSLVVAPGDTKIVTFEAGEPGTYFYSMRLGAGFDPFFDEREQLAGALVIDPKGGSPPDRIFVMNIFGTPVDTTAEEIEWLEALAINGLSFPFTERQRPAVNDTLRWRVINASGRNHPMHLHGFFYDVLSRGSQWADEMYDAKEVRTVVTEFMFRRTTMLMEWVPKRPGRWLFHCHLAFHVSPEIRLPTVRNPISDESHNQPHMAGLVLGIEVQDGPTDLISRGEPRRITLYALEFPEDTLYTYGFSLDPSFKPDSAHLPAPGPVLELVQYQPTYVTVENRMSIPTGVHWHGLELDGWSDGVPDWSASEGRVSPMIQPGESFTYKLGLMRPGTFIYHSHLDDVHQLSGGLYGPLLVFPEGQRYNPKTDHVYAVGWNKVEPESIEEAALNGRFEQPLMHARVGEAHRIRVLNIAPAGRVTVRMRKDDKPAPLRAIAKDGADLPASQQVEIEESRVFGVGETADFEFAPKEAGTYSLEIRYPWDGWTQTWVVSPPSTAGN